MANWKFSDCALGDTNDVMAKTLTRPPVPVDRLKKDAANGGL
jgi:hypothetical protein